MARNKQLQVVAFIAHASHLSDIFTRTRTLSVLVQFNSLAGDKILTGSTQKRSPCPIMQKRVDHYVGHIFLVSVTTALLPHESDSMLIVEITKYRPRANLSFCDH